MERARACRPRGAARQLDPAFDNVEPERLLTKAMDAYGFSDFVWPGDVVAYTLGGYNFDHMIGASATSWLAIHYVPRDIADGVASGRFSPMHPRLAFDLVTGPVLAAFHTLLRETVPESYPQEMAQAILQSLGMVKASARKAAQTALPPLVLPQESLLVRAEARAAKLCQTGKLDVPISAWRRPSLRRRPSAATSSSSRSGAPRGTSG